MLKRIPTLMMMTGRQQQHVLPMSVLHHLGELLPVPAAARATAVVTSRSSSSRFISTSSNTSLLFKGHQQQQQRGGYHLQGHNRRLSKVINLQSHYQQVRYKSSTPLNTVILFVPQQEAWVVERMGKFHRILEPGLNFLIPIIDRIKYVNSLKEIAIDIPKQSAITKDNVTLSLDGVLYLKIVDPFKASYGVEDPEFAITQLAQTTMRSELGKIALDTIFRERESLNISIVESINKAAESWGIACLRYEIRDIKLPPKVQEAMQMQVEAERKKRAQILESEGIRESAINVAEGQKRSQILASEAEMQEKINYAKGEAEALLTKAEARAKSIEKIAKSLTKESGPDAGSLIVAEQYVLAFQNLAKKSNTLLLPSDVSNVPSMVTQAMTIYKQLSHSKRENGDGPTDDLEEYFSDADELAEARESSKSSAHGQYKVANKSEF